MAEALPEVNELLAQVATPEQRELFRQSALDEYLRDTERDERRRAAAIAAGSDASLEPFIPRRGDGLMLSASDIETYRLCPLKYKFARVFRIPQEPTINQRFGIALHQVLERFHADGGGSHDQLMELFESSWRRCGFGDANDDQQYRERAVGALRRYWELDREPTGELVSVERSFAFKIGPHLLRGRVDRVDRLPDGTHELIDYKTGKPKTAERPARRTCSCPSTRWARARRGVSRPPRRATTTCSRTRRCRSSTPRRSSSACAARCARSARGS